MDWDEERTAALMRMWRQGMSASQVAEALGGVSRNAVIGKAHRLGLMGRGAPSRPRSLGGRPPGRITLKSPSGAARRDAAPRQPRPAPIVLEPVPDAASASILTLSEHGCRWPIGDPSDDSFGFCGLRRSGSGPYCAGHGRQAALKRPRRAPASEIDHWLKLFSIDRSTSHRGW